MACYTGSNWLITGIVNDEIAIGLEGYVTPSRYLPGSSPHVIGTVMPNFQNSPE